jgi:hypothetical protein
MIRKKQLNSILNNKKLLKFILYTLCFLTLSSIIFFSTPKLFNYSDQSIKESLKNNNNISIKNITEINYKIFPTPRLIIPSSNFTIGSTLIEVNGSEIHIILKMSQILSFKIINYKKILIKRGSSKINLKNINNLITDINKNKKKIIFKENNLILNRKNNVFFKIDESLIKINNDNKKRELIINGKFLNNEIFIELNSKLKNKNNLIVQVPKLDLLAKVFFETKNSGDNFGSFDFEILNNFLRFNFIKRDDIKVENGFIRSKLINSSINGKITFKPNFFLKLELKPSTLNMEKLFPLIQKKYFSENENILPLMKKINGIFNFKSNFEGSVLSENGEITFKDFKIGKKTSLNFNATIKEFGKKGKIHFNIIKIFQHKTNLSNRIEIKGYIVPSNEKVVFQKFLLNNSLIPVGKTKDYEDKFKKEVVQKSLINIFNEKKLNKYFKGLIKIILA